MGVLTTVKDWFSTVFDRAIKENFAVKAISEPEINTFINTCYAVYQGKPYWIDAEDRVTTINFAKSVCSEVARLATMNIELGITGSARADWLNEQISNIAGQIRAWIEYGCSVGTMILKPNGDNIDLVLPDNFRITECTDGKIRGIVFIDYEYAPNEDRWYTRLEYHRFEKDGTYKITNKTYIGSRPGDLRREVAIEATPWIGIAEEVIAEGLTDPLFAVFRVPTANNVDHDSGLSLPVFSDALEELKDLDVAYSRNIAEIYDSARLVLLDSDRLMSGVGGISYKNKDVLAKEYKLPQFVRAVEGTAEAASDVYHEINPQLNTETRLTGINALLSQIGFKCGFSNGYFVFNEKTGMITATQVESDDRRTIQLINDVRKAIKYCFDELIYALDKFADLYNLAPRGTYEISYDFADLTLNEDEDKARWYGYVTAGHVPFWYYLMRFEGMTEEEAKALEAATEKQEQIFGAEE